MEVAEGNELVGGADQATNINSTPILCTHGPSLSQAGHKHACMPPPVSPPALMHAYPPPAPPRSHACIPPPPPALMHASPPLPLLSMPPPSPPCSHACTPPFPPHLTEAQAQVHIFWLYLLHGLTQGLTVLDTLRAGGGWARGGMVGESYASLLLCVHVYITHAVCLGRERGGGAGTTFQYTIGLLVSCSS